MTTLLAVFRSILVLCAALLLLVAQASHAQGQAATACAKTLSFDDLMLLISGKVAEARVVERYIVPCGVDFDLTPDLERRLREGGAPDAIIAALRPPDRPSPGQIWVSAVDRREMAWMPPGAFQMGSPAAELGRDADEVAHSVQVERGFWLDTTEVTCGAYRQFLLANPEWQKDRIDRKYHDGNYLADWRGNEFPEGKANQPVVNVSWYAARAYAEWAGKRLPTEAEWEYAARAGVATAYWWGNPFDSARVAPAKGTTAASAALRRNHWRLVDVVGGVWEWTSSLYRDYPYQADDGRENPIAAGQRVVRGGSSLNDARMLRSANRNRSVPERCDPLVGFRCAR